MAVEGPCRVAEGEGPAKTKKQRKNESISLGRTEAVWGKRYLVASVSSYVFLGRLWMKPPKNRAAKKTPRHQKGPNSISFASLHGKEAICEIFRWAFRLQFLQIIPPLCASEDFFMVPTLLLLAAKSSGSWLHVCSLSSSNWRHLSFALTKMLHTEIHPNRIGLFGTCCLKKQTRMVGLH